jgi:cellobionic acid phosphorylase
MAELAAHTGRAADAADFAAVADTMTQRINAHAWDGEWYIYAINGQGLPIGSRTNDEGRIHLNVNTWALFTGVAAAAGREDQVWAALSQLATPLGHLLLKPSYTRPSRPFVGRIADQLPGMFENGSIYTHGESFYLYALVCAGKSDRWYEEIQKTLPCNLVPDLSTTPPHQQSNFFVGPDHPAYGTNLFSNFTGSLAWYRRSIERVIGVVPEFDGLRIAPQPPSCWDSYRVARTFRGSQLLVDVRRAVATGGSSVASGRGRDTRAACPHDSPPRADGPTVRLDGQSCPNPIPAASLVKGRQQRIAVEW